PFFHFSISSLLSYTFTSPVGLCVSPYDKRQHHRLATSVLSNYTPFFFFETFARVEPIHRTTSRYLLPLLYHTDDGWSVAISNSINLGLFVLVFFAHIPRIVPLLSRQVFFDCEVGVFRTFL